MGEGFDNMENAILLGDNCYSKGQFDEAIKWYTQAANEGYVEGMEKMLKTCVEQGRKYGELVNIKALDYWSIASMTLRGIMQHNEIVQEVKDRSYVYYEEIMRGIANEFCLIQKYEEALAALGKLSSKGNVVIEAQKIYCEFHLKVANCMEIVEKEKQKMSPQEAEEAIFPFENNVTFRKCFERMSMLEKLTKKDCDKIVRESSRSEISMLSLIIFRWIGFYFFGECGCLGVVKADEKKAVCYWKIRQMIDPDPSLKIPPEMEELLRKCDKDESHQNVQPKKETKESNKPTTRKITIIRKTINLSAIVGSARTIDILVDGRLVGGVDLGKEFTVKISKDVHTLQAKMGNNKSDMLTIPAGDYEYTYSVELKAHMLSNEIILSEIGYALPDGELVKKSMFDSEDAKGIAEWVKYQFESDGGCYQLLANGAYDVFTFVKKDKLSIEWTGDARGKAVVFHGVRGTKNAKLSQHKKLENFTDMIQTTGGKVSFTWREFTDEFVLLDEDQRYELLQMIHERVSELPYLKGDMGKYRFKKKGLFW